MLYLADSDVQMNQRDEAKALLEKLLKLSPDNAMAHRDLGIVITDRTASRTHSGNSRRRSNLPPTT